LKEIHVLIAIQTLHIMKIAHKTKTSQSKYYLKLKLLHAGLNETYSANKLTFAL